MDGFKIFSKVLQVALMIYITFIVVLFFQQRTLIYMPDKSRPSIAATVVQEMQTVQIETDDGLTNESWLWMPTDDPTAKIVVLFQGNSSNIGGRAPKARHFIDAGIGIMMIGYRGYGGNGGDPSQEGLFNDARAALKYLTIERGISPGRIVLYGESLGAGVATKMASELPLVGGLVLEVPFDSALDLARDRYWFVLGLSYLMKDPFRSDLYIKDAKMPKLFLIAGRDDVIPARHGKRLFKLAPEPKMIHEFPKGRHNNLYDFGAADVIIGFVNNHVVSTPVAP